RTHRSARDEFEDRPDDAPAPRAPASARRRAPALHAARSSPPRCPDSARAPAGTPGSRRDACPRAAPRPGSPPPSPPRSGPARPHGTSGLRSCAWLPSSHLGDGEVTEPPADLAQRLEHVGAGALRGAIEALPDRIVVQLVDLSHGERQALLQWQRGDDGADPVTRLLEHCFPFRPAGVLWLVTMADGLVSPPAPRLRPPVIPTEIRRDRQRPCAPIGAGGMAP